MPEIWVFLFLNIFLGSNIACISVCLICGVILKSLAFTGEKTIPKWIQWIIPVCVCFSTLGATNGTMFGAARLTFAAAREGHLMTTLSFCDVNKKTPSTALYFLTFLSCVYVIPGDFSALLNYFSFAAWLFYGLTVFGVILMRFTQPDAERPIKVPIVIPAIFVLIAAYLVVAPLVNNFEWAYVGAAGFILLGLVVYYLPVVYCGYNCSFMTPLVKFFQYLFMVAPSTYNEVEDKTLELDDGKGKSSEKPEAEA